MAVAAAVSLVLAVATPASAQDAIEAADTAAFDGYFVEDGAVADLGRLSDLALEADADDQEWYFVSLFQPAEGSNGLFANDVLAEVPDSGTVVVVSPFDDGLGGFDVGIASDDWSSTTIDRALDDASLLLDPGSGTAEDRFEAVFDALSDRTPDFTAADAESDDDSPVSGAVVAGAGLAAVGAIGGGVWLSRRRSEAKAAERDRDDLETARTEIKAQLDAVANQIIDDSDVIETSGKEQAITWFREASATFSEVDDSLPRTNTLLALADLNDKMDQARWKMEAALATAHGRPVPAQPEPDEPVACFFDPTHRPGSEVATVSTPAGSKEVNVCAMDAEKLRKGERPDPRMIEVHGKRVPAARAPRSHGGLGMGGIDLFDIVLGGGRPQRRSRSGRRSGGLGGLGGMFPPTGRSTGGGMFDWTPPGSSRGGGGFFGTDRLPRTASNRPRRSTSRSGGPRRSGSSRSSSRRSSSSRPRTTRRARGGGRRRM